ncbi:MAG: hypothetical protein K8S99_16675 [Planctomycetes bacterium]|nr:hypothetical protein [Planctomycetota bacterium]
MLDGPGELIEALKPVLDARPMDRALMKLVVDGGGVSGGVAWVESAIARPEGKILRGKPALAAGLWLYVDELDRSHKISQTDESDPTLSYWHGIMHRREGDFSNSHYWFRRVGAHPAMALVGGGYDVHRLIDDVETAHRAGRADEKLVALQRREWETLMRWCYENA